MTFGVRTTVHTGFFPMLLPLTSSVPSVSSVVQVSIPASSPRIEAMVAL